MKSSNSVGARLMFSFAGVIVVFGIAMFVSIGRLSALNNIVSSGPDLAASVRSAQLLMVALSLAAATIACLLAYRSARAFKIQLSHAAAVLGDIEKCNYPSQVTVTSNDELAHLLQGLERMQVALRARADKEQASAIEQARIRAALDHVHAGVMLVDPHAIVRYVNDALLAMFRKQASTIRKQLPQFDPERILGGSLEIFHQVPAFLPKQMAALTAPHTAEFKIGEASLRIVASPALNGSGQRVGTVVQWTDRTLVAAREDEVQQTVALAINGDLTARIRETDKETFFKALASGVNRLLENMADVVRRMSQATAEVRAGAQEISRGNADLSLRTKEQAASLEETASSMEEMTSTVRNNADNAAQANQLASAAREQAERGGKVVSAAVAAMSEINASSKKIADITSVIDEIAFQTNLLALNAAVEAARAGEQGRGFAVVASEVRNLASRSAEAAKEIKALIHDSVGKVTEGTKLVDESGKALGEIVSRVKKVTDVVAEIAGSSREQASGIEQVNKAITMMDDVTQQNAALVEEAAAAAQALTEQASNLTQLIARYRIGDVAAQDLPQPILRRAAPVATQLPVVERRAANRPLSGKKKPVSPPTVLAQVSGPSAGGDEQWKDF